MRPGAIPPGPIEGDDFEFARPRLDLREQFTDLNPEFTLRRDAWFASVDWQNESWAMNVSGAMFEVSRSSLQDLFLDVGPRLNPTPGNPTGLWPTSNPPRRFFGARSGPCNLDDLTAGVFGGCTLNAVNRAFAADVSSIETEFQSAEVRIHSKLDGPLNVLAGVHYLQNDVDGGLFLSLNSVDALGLFDNTPGLRLYPTILTTETRQESQSASRFFRGLLRNE